MLSPKPWQPWPVIIMACWIWLGICAGAMILHIANPHTRTEAEQSVGEPTGATGVQPEEAAKDPAWQMFSLGVGVLCLHGVALAAIAGLVREHRTTWSRAFGFDEPDKKEALRLAALTAAAAMPAGMLITILCGLALQSAGMEPETQKTVQLVQSENAPGNLLALGVVAILIAPVVEELLFRGVFYPTLKQQGHPVLAVVGVSLLFALSHANAMTFLPLALLSAALIWLYEKTNNLLAPIVAHALFNAANFIMIVSGAFPS